MSRAEPRHIPPRKGTVATDAGGSDDGGTSSLLRSTGSVAIATLTSRLTGFLRTVLLAAILGGAVWSSFTVANQMPQQVSELVLGQVLAALVIPVLIRAEMEDKDRGQAFFERLFTMSLVILGGALIIAMLISPLLVGWLVGKADSQVNAPLTQALVYLLLPQLVFYGLSALFTAVLNTRAVFRPGAWAPVATNVIQIGTLVLFYLMPGELTLNPVEMSDPKLLVLGLGSTLGVIVQACIQLPALKRSGIKLRLRWGVDDRLKHFGGMGVAIIAYVFISLLGSYLVTPVAAAASETGPGVYANVWLVLQLPYGVLGVALLTAVMPRLSRHAAEGNRTAVVDDLSLATRITMVALVPVVAFATAFGPSIGRALFNYGQMSVAEANHLGTAISFEAFVLIPYAMVLIHLRVFYAQERPWTPTFIVLAITGVKTGLSYLVPQFVDDGNRVVELLGTATGLAYAAGALVGWILLRRNLGRMQLTNVARTLLQTTAVSALVVVTVYAIMHVSVLQKLDKSGPLGALIYLALAGVLSMTLIYALLALWRVPDVLAILAPLRRIAGRFVPALRPAAPSAPAPAREPAEAVTAEFRLEELERFASLRQEEITAQMPRIADDIGLPYAGQSHVPRRSEARADNPTTGLRYRRRGAFAVTEDDSARPTGPAAPGTGPMPLPSTPQPAAGQPGAPAPIDGYDDAPRGPQLIPGAVVAGGRYRLTEHYGGIRGLQFWQARDINLDRDVALTFVDSEQREPVPERGAQISMRGEGPQSILSRTLRLGRVHSNGLARVLDVVRGSSGGIVVAEWIPSYSLADVAGTHPSAIAAAKAVRSLASAAEGAHRAGAALSIDHPDRVRISQDGNAFLAFPGTLADATKESDVRGLGAVLYALLLEKWPLDETTGRIVTTGSGTVSGLQQADADAAGNPVEPRDAKSDIPFEISAVATRTLEGGQGIRTAATVQQLLDQASVVDVKTDLLAAVRDDAPAAARPAAATAAPAAQQSLQSRPTPPKRVQTGKRPKNVPLLIIAACAVVLLLIIGLTLLISSLTSEKDTQSGVGSLYPAGQSSSTIAAPAAPGIGSPVKATAVSLVDFSSNKDSAVNIGNVLTGQEPAWKTDTYKAGPVFGNLKKGVGLLITLDKPVSLTGGAITSPSAGSTIEVRTSSKETVKSIDETSVVWSGTLRPGANNFHVSAVAPRTKYVVVWITGLTKVEGNDWYTTINQVSFQGT
ncbi:Virulence factor MVIN family protein OS=Tsukamurella paurometabola (strain ATCC 8368 / DSM /CCUG 35730 / CIP 100753 / JCM 10117 / KCTC 9821 / NBRC 16120/ NCIMB 702349 / NCTC 13040) OX=521096 GN=Tpau_4226 PE=4 SV=1 [Tsukamurella paurometabola]|uniref:Virulence factor MVIN family protein n=1 Tax=Tsukamurella paurometabola (strain ATCC 8368 / DSM 20162 / CCUG 35730 / CIP 100753 / JCM 10117 / KCTC 9821 / NBRC 16120 / NCIMB 702349 / NCTC 13040) TaxID=521096 RepID=D5UP85_TSUPD|nr:murein biosynthesis integral membrane protein MurJ [Tsukamurella paurometabola]ADG80794.1 virulence factor MVIN family protein [Tsukamurella paurometabola DSM 20162]SUP41013.1 Probable peptidoglycan biosynthesis protein MurJ [Tsukamurella paurometabola]